MNAGKLNRQSAMAKGSARQAPTPATTQSVPNPTRTFGADNFSLSGGGKAAYYKEEGSGASPATQDAAANSTLDQARAKADELWDEGGDTDDFRVIETDATDANGGGSSRYDAGARKQLTANDKLESAARAKLSSSQQGQYDALRRSMGDKPQAQLALQLLLIEGKLTKSQSKDGKDLLSTLDGLSRQTLAKELDRTDLMSGLLRELDNPACINQQNRGTCAATTCQIKLALDNPAEYARLVAGLGSPDGKVTLMNGDTLPREPGTESKDDSPRTPSSRMVQSALMEYANGDLDYDNTQQNTTYQKAYRKENPDAPEGDELDKDLHSDGSWGLSGDEVARIQRGLTGKKVESRGVSRDDGVVGWFSRKFGSDYSPEEMLKAIKKQNEDGKTVPVGLKWGDPDPKTGVIHGGHEVLVTSVEKGRVHYINPWGQRENMSESDFKKRIKNAPIKR